MRRPHIGRNVKSSRRVSHSPSGSVVVETREGNMDYELSEEQKLIQETAYKFAVNEIEPIAKECDREERYPREVWKKA